MANPTRKEVEKVVRKLLASKAGEKKFAPNLFNDTVNQIMKEYEDGTQNQAKA